MGEKARRTEVGKPSKLKGHQPPKTRGGWEKHESIYNNGYII
jgi:hypothetical protein